jgi:O-antigen/teichoic acid export membrane protein
MAAVSLLAFPLIAAIDQQREPERVRQYVSQTAKVTLVLLAFMSAIGSACSREVQALLFPKAYGEAADQLRLMVWGFSGYSFAVTVAWILNSAKRPQVAVVLVAVPLATVAIGGYVVIPTLFTGGAAWAVAGAGLLAAIAAGIALVRVFDAGVPLLQLARIAVCVAAVELLAWVWPTMATSGLVGKLLIVTKLGVLAVTFVGVALVVRATTVAEIRGLRRAK